MGRQIEFSNLAATVRSWLQNAATVARTYTFQDRNGTIADDTDLALKQSLINAAGALVDGAAITLSAKKHTLTTDEALVTFTDTYTGDSLDVEVTFSTTVSAWTFPANSLCKFITAAGVTTVSGDNTMAVTGTSGDKIILRRWLCGANKYYTAENFGQ
jgi:hypothetical protein